MEYSIRPARASDQDTIREFTTDTFHWGDYVGEVFADWIADPAGQVMVATDASDRAVAVGRGLMLSDNEAWLQGARVHKDWRRRGIATAIGDAIIAWSVSRGAAVARLAIEEWNTAARRQVESGEFRLTGHWLAAERSVTSDAPSIPSNGGRRSRARRKLEQVPSAEAVPAWISWRSGSLVGPARGLHTSHWRWSQLRLDQLETAASNGELWSSQAGWARVERDEDRIRIGWLECGPEDGMDMVRSLLDLAQETKADQVQITIPLVPWLAEVLRSLNFEPFELLIYERSI